MRRATMLPAAALALLATACVSERTEAQALAQRVRAAGDGMVEMRYATRPGICGDGRRYFSIGRHSYYRRMEQRRRTRHADVRVPGARVRMRVERGAVTDVRLTVGPAVEHARDERATDLGEVPSAEAAAFFLGSPTEGSGGRPHGAIMAAVVADSVSVWQRLLAIATDTRARVGLDAARRDVLGGPLRRGEGDRTRRGYRRDGGRPRTVTTATTRATRRCSRCRSCAGSRASSRCSRSRARTRTRR